MPTIEFLITSLIVVLIPGTGVLFTVSTGLLRGWRAAVFAAVGCTAGILPHLLASLMGLAALLYASALAFQLLKYVGAAYLLYLAWKMWNESGQLQLNQAAGTGGGGQIVSRGFLINILNPKLSVFFLAFLPQFISADAASPVSQMVILGGVFMAMTLVVFILYGFLADRVRRHLVASPNWVRGVQRAFAGVFALLGVRLAMAER